MTEDGRAAGLGVKALAAVFVVLTFALSIFRFLDGDEFEHVHSAWHVLNGAIPYVDFFEHHHPLLWYLLAPVLALTGESATPWSCSGWVSSSSSCHRVGDLRSGPRVPRVARGGVAERVPAAVDDHVRLRGHRNPP